MRSWWSSKLRGLWSNKIDINAYHTFRAVLISGYLEVCVGVIQGGWGMLQALCSISHCSHSQARPVALDHIISNRALCSHSHTVFSHLRSPPLTKVDAVSLDAFGLIELVHSWFTRNCDCCNMQKYIKGLLFSAPWGVETDCLLESGYHPFLATLRTFRGPRKIHSEFRP